MFPKNVPNYGVPKVRDEEDVPEENVPEKSGDMTEQTKLVIENWIELKDATLPELFEKGWKPRVKTRQNHKRYIMLRLTFKDEEDGRWRDSERSLGLFDPERWDALMSLYSASTSQKEFPKEPVQFPERGHGKSSVLATKVARPSSIGPTVHLELETLHWYEWIKKKSGFPGTLDDFINQSVNVLFKEHYNLELAVVDQGGQII